MSAHALLAVVTGLFLRPLAGRFEQDLAWGLLAFGYLANVVRFLAEALKFGRWPPPPASYATNWVRYTGAGFGSLGLIGSFAALSRGGIAQFFYTVLGVAAYYALFTFAALAFETNEAVIGFFVIGVLVVVGTWAVFCRSGRTRWDWWVVAISMLLEVAFVTMTGIEVFRRKTASNSLEDWLFVGVSIAKGLWYLVVYLGGVNGVWIKELVPAASTTTAVYSHTAVYTPQF